ncbi:MAG: restriction endonuclease subunit S, partial [Candidatus Thiodiazotropha taylori]|nr:restriction endonuclease subunit S [Candidatus Thiodiazotropha taylori]
PGQHDESGIPVIRVNNVNNGQLDLSDVLKVSPEVEIKYARTRLKGGEVLLTLVGSTGQSFVAPEELSGWNVPRAIAVIRADEEVGADWINICLQSKETKHFLNVRANTTVQKTLNLKDVRDIPILIPPNGVKKSIEGIALSLSKKIDLNRRTNQTLEQIAQAIFKSWFVDFEPVKAKMAVLEAGGTAEQAELAAISAISAKDQATLKQLQTDQPEAYAELAQTAALFPSAIEESELGKIPEGWEVTKTEQLAEKIAMGPFGSNIKVSTFVDSGVPIISGHHLKETLVTEGNHNFITEEHATKLKNSCVTRGDIVFTHAGNIGQVSLIPEST